MKRLGKRISVFLIGVLCIGSSPAEWSGASSGEAAGRPVRGELVVRFKSATDMGLNETRFQSVSAGLSGVPAALNALHQKSGLRRIRRLSRRVGVGRGVSRPLQRRLAARAERAPRPWRELTASLKDSLDRTAVLSFDTSRSIDDIVREYRANPAVELVEPHYRSTAFLVPTDPSYSVLWGMTKIQAPQAWDVHTGSGVVVAVVDTGVDYNHPDLAATMWVNVDEVAGNGVDDDGNGFVDDARGWNFAYGNANPMDDHSHGTHVAGTVAAVANNSVGVVGVAFNARWMAVKGLDSAGSGGNADLAAGVIYAADNGADVINASWGGTVSDSVLSNAVAYAQSHGVVVVAAAGNSNADVSGFYPASYPGVIAVAATDTADQRAAFSNWGSRIDVSAPGVSIFSTKPGASYGYLQGTSMASPHVAGVAALVLSKFPALSVAQVRTSLLSAVDDVGPPGFDIQTGHGRINAFKAVQAGAPLEDTLPPTVAILTPADGATVSGALTVTGSAGDNAGLQQIAVFVDGVLKAFAVGTTSWSSVLETTGYSNGPHTLSARATDTSGLQTPTTISLTFNNVNEGNALFLPAYGAPGCLLPGAYCDSGSLSILGRGSMASGIEPNAPNTLLPAGCADGNSGTFHSDESLDRLKVVSVDGSPLESGKSVRVEATVWAYNSFTSDFLDIFGSSDAANPVWVPVATLQPSRAGAQTLSTTYTLPPGSLQAVRANFRYSGVASACSGGTYDDRDDLVFSVIASTSDVLPPVISGITPAALTGNSAEIRWTTNEPADSQVEYGLTTGYGQLSPLKAALETSHALPLTGLSSGVLYHFRVRSRDAAGNLAVSSDMTFVTPDTVPPVVSVTLPAEGSTLTGPALLTGFAADSVSVAHVTLYIDGRLWKTLAGVGPALLSASGRAEPPVESAEGIDVAASLSWSFSLDTTQLDNGPHVLRFESGDGFNNVGVSSRTVTTDNGSIIASYDPVRQTPACGLPGAVCASGGRLEGRGSVAPFPEQNQPNTLQSSCGDGTGGTYHSDESLDWLKVSSLDGLPLTPGKGARVDVKGWVFSKTENVVDLFVAADAQTPGWVLLKSLPSAGTRSQVYSTTFTVPVGGEYQAIRGLMRFGTGAGACVPGLYNDHDDLVYRISTVPGAPATVRLSTGTSQTLVFSWGGATGQVDGYRIDASADPGFTAFLPGYQDRNVGSATMWTIDGLSPQTTYYARVRAVNAGGASAHSPTAIGATLGLSDLIVKSLSYKSPVAPGETFQTRLEIQNIGAWTTGLPVGWSLWNNGVLIYSGGLPPLGAGEEAAPGEWSVTAPSVEGTYLLEARVNRDVSPPLPETDTTNNTKAISYIVDGTPPVVAITTPAASASVAGVVPVAALATDAGSGVDRVVFSVDGIVVSSRTAAPYEFAWNTNAVADGSHTLSVSATDRGGLSSASSVSVFVNNTDAAQRTSLSGGPAATVFARKPFTVWVGMKNTGSSTWSSAGGYKLRSQSPEGNATWGLSDVSLGSSVVAPGKTVTLSVYLKAPAAPGTYTAHFKMFKNGVGAFGDDAIRQTVTVIEDTSPPSPPTGLLAGGPSTSTVILTWKAASDNAAVASYRLDVSTLSAFEALLPGYADLNAGSALSRTLTGLSAGVSYFARVRAVDVNGLVSGNSVPVAFATLSTPDVASPTVALTSPVEGALVTGPVLVKAVAADNVEVRQVTFLVDGVSRAVDTAFPYEFTWSNSGVVAGTHTLTARAVDYAGNMASQDRIVLLNFDGAPPSVPGNPKWEFPTVSKLLFGWQASTDNVGTAQYQIQVSTNPDFSVFIPGFSGYSVGNVTSYSVSGLKAGVTYYGRVRAADANGNVSAFSVPAAGATLASADVTKPTVTISTPAAGSVVGGTVTVNAIAADNVAVTKVLFYVDSVLKFTDLAGPHQFDWDTRLVSSGTHKVMAVAYDPSNNTGAYSVTLTVSPSGTGAAALSVGPEPLAPADPFGLKEVVVFPSPVRGDRATVRILSGDTDSVRLTISSANGDRVREMLAGTAPTLVNGRWVVDTPLDVSDFSSGVYFLTVEVAKGGETQRKTSKFVVIR